ncbi:MAG: hypothetical protein AAGF82_09470 [Pseudomonadota bacterium]
MRKSKKSHKQAAKKQHKPQPQNTGKDVDESRRALFRKVRNGAIGITIVGGLGGLLARNVYATMREHDLSRLANGRPTIVQIHDPQCRMCLALQKETRKALKAFDGDALDYVVANIRTADGRAFANRYGAQHVTLLLFDAGGNLQQVLQGQRSSATLQTAFRRLL